MKNIWIQYLAIRKKASFLFITQRTMSVRKLTFRMISQRFFHQSLLFAQQVELITNGEDEGTIVYVIIYDILLVDIRQS